MNRFRHFLNSAGFSSVPTLQVIAVVVTFSFAVSMISYVVTTVLGFALAVFALSVTGAIELLRILRLRRNKALLEIWPGVFESFESGFRAGVTVPEQISDLAELGPSLLRDNFHGFHQRILAGWSVADCANWFQLEFDNRYVDQFVMLIRMSELYGLTKVADSWSTLAKRARQDIRSEASIESKQSWLMGIAKISVLAPWIVSLILIQRPEGRISYQSEVGFLIMLIALAVSIGAYLLTEKLGRQNSIPRIFNAIA